jgi:phosphogluconate dehydratase
MSGASGTVPAAIHVTPEASAGGPLARVLDGDMIRIDAHTGQLDVLVDPVEFAARPPASGPPSPVSVGRQLFATMRAVVGPADRGASIFRLLGAESARDHELEPTS